MASLFGQFQLLQSGYAGPEEKNIPIEVPWKSLSSWLISCGLTTRDILNTSNVNKTVDRSMELFNQLEAQNGQLDENHPLRVLSVSLARKQSLVPWIYSYFDYLIIFESLLEHTTENKGKTLLGNFQSPLLHSWEDTRAKWAKYNAHIAHAALVLYQAVRYEAPIMKASLEHANKVFQTSQAKELSLSATVEKEISNYESLFLKYSLPVHSLDEPISQSDLEIKLSADFKRSLSSTLPSAADALVNSFKQSPNLQDAVKFFTTWMSALIPQEKFISTLQLVLDQGSSLLLPYTIEDTSENVMIANTNESDAIDWGDWGIEVSSPEPSTAPTSAIEVLSSTEATTASPSQVRKSLANDLESMTVFFKQRISDLTSSNDFLDLVMGRSFSALPEYVRQHGSLPGLNRYLQAVIEARTALNTFETENISIVESDVRLLEIVSSLMQKHSKIVQLRRSLQVVATRRQESLLQVEHAKAKIGASKEAIFGLKAHLEAALSKICGGRIVTISLNVEL